MIIRTRRSQRTYHERVRLSAYPGHDGDCHVIRVSLRLSVHLSLACAGKHDVALRLKHGWSLLERAPDFQGCLSICDLFCLLFQSHGTLLLDAVAFE